MATAVVYFSRAGQNYIAGEIQDLKEGNTYVTAHKIALHLHSLFFELKPVDPYPVDYHECTERAQRELERQDRPALADDLDISGIDTVVLCYPCWFDTFPRAVATFLELHSFAGKTIIPVCTHEGSGMGHSESELKKMCPKSEIKRGLAIRGSQCHECDAAIAKYFD